MNYPGKNPNWQRLATMQVSGRAQVNYPTQFDMVQMFHHLADLPIRAILDRADKASLERRKTLILEEVMEELVPALDKLKADYCSENLAHVLDGCVDAVYVIMGCCLELGLPFDTAFALVQEANMQKVRDEVLRRKDGKILKPEGWKAPDILGLVKLAERNEASIAHQMQAPDRPQ